LARTRRLGDNAGMARDKGMAQVQRLALLCALDAVTSSIRMVVGVRSGLRQPPRLTVLAIAGEAPAVVFYALRVARPCGGAGRLSPGRSRIGSPAAGSIG
jgi:hypothetical protein